MEIGECRVNLGIYLAVAEGRLQYQCLGYTEATCKTRALLPNQFISATGDFAALENKNR